MRKKFTDIKEGNKLYILIDRNFQLDEGDSAGFGNTNYGITLFTKYVTKIHQHYPRRGDSVLLQLILDSDILYEETNSFLTFEEGRILFSDNLCISKDEGELTSVTRNFCNYTAYNRNMPKVHIFTTKEEMTEWIEEKTKSIADNLKRLNHDLETLL